MNELTVLVSTFVDPIALMMALVLATSVLRRKQLSALQYEFAVGSLFSLAIIYSMSNPMPIYSGGIFDMRFLLIGTAAALIGPTAGGMALATGTIYRVMIGGAGVAPGVVGALIVYAAGLAWRYYVKDRDFRDWQQAVILGFMLTLHSLSTFLAPSEVWATLFKTLVPYMLLVNVLGSLLIKQLLFNEFLYYSQAENHRTEAFVDHLTGLQNRRSLERRYADLSRAKRRRGEGISVVYFDVDKFKSVNDQFGHATGDQVLKSIADCLKPVLRQEDVFARLSGDEFVIVLPNIQKPEAILIAERCRRTIADRKIMFDDVEIAVTVSIGAIWLEQDLPIHQALQRADRLLYSAKEQGRNNVAFDHSDIDPAMPPNQKAA